MTPDSLISSSISDRVCLLDSNDIVALDVEFEALPPPNRLVLKYFLQFFEKGWCA